MGGVSPVAAVQASSGSMQNGGRSPCRAAEVGSAHLSACGQASEDVFPNSLLRSLPRAASPHGSGFPE